MKEVQVISGMKLGDEGGRGSRGGSIDKYACTWFWWCVGVWPSGRRHELRYSDSSRMQPCSWGCFGRSAACVGCANRRALGAGDDGGLGEW